MVPGSTAVRTADFNNCIYFLFFGLKKLIKIMKIINIPFLLSHPGKIRGISNQIIEIIKIIEIVKIIQIG